MTARRHKGHPWLFMWALGISIVAFSQGALYVGVLMLAAALWLVIR